MTYKLNDKHIENVLGLAAPDRYDYFIKHVADWDALWGLSEEDGWVIASDDEEKELFPVWPHYHFAELCAKGLWSGAKPEKIDLSDWLDYWTPKLSQTKRMVAVFPLPTGGGIPVDPKRIEGDLREERSRIE